MNTLINFLPPIVIVGATTVVMLLKDSNKSEGQPTPEFRTRVNWLGECIIEQVYTGTVYGDEIMGTYQGSWWKRVGKVNL